MSNKSSNCLLREIALVPVVAIAILTTFTPGATACPASEGSKAHLMSALPAGAVSVSQLSQDLSASHTGDPKTSIVGLWKGTLSVDGQNIGEGFEAFHSDGTEILVDNSAPATDNVCLGVWEQTGPSTYKLKHPSYFFDLSGNLLGTLVIRETLTLDRDGDSFSGPVTIDAYDTSGNKLSHTDARIQATRIRPD